MKELHFFSRQRNWSKGYTWYESCFKECSPDKKAGEFSTSYLVDPITPERIHNRYPNTKLIASLRNPVDRAFSNYMIDIESGQVSPDTPFMQALEKHPEYVEQGRYATQLRRYLKFFDRKQILVLIYDDISVNPANFIEQVYRFIGVDSNFIPALLTTRVHPSRVPKSVWLDRQFNQLSILFRKRGLAKVWWSFKKMELGTRIRSFNTRQEVGKTRKLSLSEQRIIYDMVKDEIIELEHLLGRELKGWRP